MTGLANGVWYRFTVTATSEYGTGPHSTWEGNCVGSNDAAGRSSSVCTGSATATPPTAYWVTADQVHGGVSPGRPPAQPRGVSASAHPTDPQGAIVSFSAPADDGGHTIISYTVGAYTANTGTGASPAADFTGAGDSSPITVTGLTAGTAYYFNVRATNSWAGLQIKICT